MKRYIVNALIGFDQFINALLGGDPDMTLSGRMGRAVEQGRCSLCRPVCWVLGKLDKDHCAVAAKHEADEGADETVRL
jgi:hypothetical protein